MTAGGETRRGLRGHAADGVLKDRRRVLLGLGVAAGGALACPMLARAAPAEAERQAADAPTESDDIRQSVSPFGLYQAGIVTPRPAAGMVAAFDVVAQSPKELADLFRRLTERIVFLTKGGEVPQRDPLLPPADSGLLGPVIEPDDLTVTLSLGASLFDNRDWLKPLRPRQLQRMVQFPNDALEPSICHGDLTLQFCANSQDTNIHALRDILKTMSDAMVIRWKQEGSVPVVPKRADGAHESARNFLGFHDGSANPDSTDEALMSRVVWVDADAGEPRWARHGSYQVVRIIRNLVEDWDRTPLREQERIIGRTKIAGAPLSGGTEADVPDYGADPHGILTPLDAHIRLANPRLPETEKNLMLRRPFNYSNGVSANGQLEQGLLFIAYQAALEDGFIAVQERLNGEPLEEYIRPVGGGYFFALPGMRDTADYLGRSLVEAAA